MRRARLLPLRRRGRGGGGALDAHAAWRPRGFFHPENLTFGQPVYLSRIYAAVEAVEGVDSAVVRVLRRYGRASAGELEAGVLPLGRGEIAQLENDPNFLEHGVLRVEALGGKA